MKNNSMLPVMIAMTGICLCLILLWIGTIIQKCYEPKEEPYDYIQNSSFNHVRSISKEDTTTFFIYKDAIITFTDSKGYTRIFRAPTQEEIERYFWMQEYRNLCLQEQINKASECGGTIYFPTDEKVFSTPDYQEWLKNKRKEK